MQRQHVFVQVCLRELIIKDNQPMQVGTVSLLGTHEPDNFVLPHSFHIHEFCQSQTYTLVPMQYCHTTGLELAGNLTH
jgi:hypothetical protein